MIFGEMKYSIALSDINKIYAALDAIRRDPASGLVKKAIIKYEDGSYTLEIKVLIPPQVAIDSIVRMFPSVEQALYPLSWKEETKP
ncbi:MAG: hypothetical protein J6Y92_10005 [Lentisphaeria bacterium]|nr:hypothetical protein [Lentisphaeria bacterium]